VAKVSGLICVCGCRLCVGTKKEHGVLLENTRKHHNAHPAWKIHSLWFIRRKRRDEEEEDDGEAKSSLSRYSEISYVSDRETKERQSPRKPDGYKRVRLHRSRAASFSVFYSQ